MSDALLPNADCFEQSSKIAANQPIEANPVTFRKAKKVVSRQPSGKRDFGFGQIAFLCNQLDPRPDSHAPLPCAKQVGNIRTFSLSNL